MPCFMKHNIMTSCCTHRNLIILIVTKIGKGGGLMRDSVLSHAQNITTLYMIQGYVAIDFSKI